MKDLFKEYLFNKHILVGEEVQTEENAFNALVAFKNKLGIKITKGDKYASVKLLEFAADRLGEYIPQPFYRSFPESVKELTKDQLLFDQLFHYYKTYWMGNFDEVGHSVFEENFERLAFNEYVTPKEFMILSEDDAERVLKYSVGELLSSTRPLSDSDYTVVLEIVKDYKVSMMSSIPCKQTVVKLLYDTLDVNCYAKHLQLSDIIKLVDYINYVNYNNENLKKLNLKNKDRKLITKTINWIFQNQYNQGKNRIDIETCDEKKKIWCGLLHHIHYKPINRAAEDFLHHIRYSPNESCMSAAEKLIAAGKIAEAARHLYYHKGSSVVLRNLNYLLSRCKTEQEIMEVLSWVE